MADECTDVTTIEELIICCRWVESGVPEEHFIEILPLKKANAESIYSALVEYCREKNIQLGGLIGMGFDGAATFSGDKIGVQRRLKELSPQVVCPLSLSCPSTGFSASCLCYTRCAESLKEIQKVLDHPELKIEKPSDTLARTWALCQSSKSLQRNSSCSWKYIWNSTWTRSSWTK